MTAIEFIHLNKLIHRDIKAADILMTEKGEIKLTDFGLSIDREKNTILIVGRPHGKLIYLFQYKY